MAYMKVHSNKLLDIWRTGCDLGLTLRYESTLGSDEGDGFDRADGPGAHKGFE
jgi:hypothetical protein